jgi:hypothetical protein
VDDDSEIHQRRSTFLTVLFTVLFGGGAILFSFLLCGGLAIYALAVVGGLVAFGAIHYFLWGHTMSTQVTAEREEMEREGELEADGWNWDEPHWHHRL